jgi:signal peptidase II
VSRTQSDQLKFKQNILVLFIITINFLLDRISKIWIINFFSSGQNEYYINPFLNFILIWNKGIAFGFFDSENLTYHMISLVIFIILGFIVYMIITSNKIFEKICLSILLGGALGNFFDRLYYQAVPDFIDLHYNNFHWFVFNVSDISITIGIILLLINELIKGKEKTDE